MTITVAMVAPVSPYRGGIAQHSTMLANALARHCDLKVFSYNRLYPSILYPGQFQKDEETGLTSNVSPRFTLDTINPISWYRTAREVLKCEAKVLILPWWTFFLTPCYVVIKWIVSRKGIRIVFLCHNFIDHETAWWKKYFSMLALRNASCFLVHANSIRNDLKDAIPSIPTLVRPMPSYEDYPCPTTILPRRAPLELLFFGFIRKYKGLDVLLRALAMMKQTDWHLSVVGECWDDCESYIRLTEELGIFDKVEFSFHYVSNEKAANVIVRADYLVLPYRAATGSAVISLAYHYDTPVIVTPVGGLPEVVENGITGIVVPDMSISALTEVLDGIHRRAHASFEKGIRRWKEENSWDALALSLLKFVSHSEQEKHL